MTQHPRALDGAVLADGRFDDDDPLNGGLDRGLRVDRPHVFDLRRRRDVPPTRTGCGEFGAASRGVAVGVGSARRAIGASGFVPGGVRRSAAGVAIGARPVPLVASTPARRLSRGRDRRLRLRGGGGRRRWWRGSRWRRRGLGRRGWKHILDQTRPESGGVVPANRPRRRRPEGAGKTPPLSPTIAGSPPTPRLTAGRCARRSACMKRQSPVHRCRSGCTAWITFFSQIASAPEGRCGTMCRFYAFCLRHSPTAARMAAFGQAPTQQPRQVSATFDAVGSDPRDVARAFGGTSTAGSPKGLAGVWGATSVVRDGRPATDVVGHLLTFTENRFEIQAKDGKRLYTGHVPAPIHRRHPRRSTSLMQSPNSKGRPGWAYPTSSTATP